MSVDDEANSPASDGGADDLARLVAERDRLASRLDQVERRGTGRRRARRVAVVVLLVLGCASFTLAAVGVWVRHNVADTDVWVERAGPLADDPAVQAALSHWLTGEVVDLVDPAKLFDEALPQRGRVLAAPLAGAIESFIGDRIDRFLASDEFKTLWVAANERAHRSALRVLRGDAQGVGVGDRSVTIDLVPVINRALAQVSAASPELLGRQVKLPKLSADEVPQKAIDRLNAALGTHLGNDFGQVTIYDEGRLSAIQTGVDQARRLLIVVAVAAVVCLAGALALSDRRRRTLLQMLAGLAIGIAVIRRLGIRSQSELLSSIHDSLNRHAADAVSDRFVSPLLSVTRWILVALALVAVVTVLTGPYPGVVRLRAATAEQARRLAANLQGGAEATAGSGDWVQAHRGALQAAGVVVGVGALLLLSLSFLGMAALAVVVGLYELALRPAAARP